jgi:hypothetical protein
MSKLRQSQRRKNRPATIKTKTKKSFTLNDIYNASPRMLHEKDFVAIDCVLCNATMKSVHDTHEARPLAPSQTAKQAFEQKKNIGRCCSACNTTRVLPARSNLRYAA